MIRDYQSSDIDQIIPIWLEASIKAHDFVKSEFWESKVRDMREVYIPASETYVYDQEGVVIGFISLGGETIAALFVTPSYQGAGIGSKLMAKAKELCAILNLTVYKENRKSVEFYIKCGFQIKQERLDQHTGQPELVMVFPA